MINHASKQSIYDYRLKDKHGRYKIIAFRDMADGVLTSSLEQAWARYFSAHKFCRKTEGRVLTPVFGTAMNLYKMTSNEEVFYMKKLGIVDVNNFIVRAMII